MQGGGELPWEVTCRGVVDGIAMVIHMTRREGRRFVEEAGVKGTTRRRINGTFKNSNESRSQAEIEAIRQDRRFDPDRGDAWLITEAQFEPRMVKVARQTVTQSKY